MKRIFLLFLFPAIIFAGNIDLSLKNNDGQSSYTVNSNNSQNLKSELIFPFNYNSIDLGYKYKLGYFNIYINSSFLLKSKTEKGKDYDWQNNNLTVYSQSDNKIDKYYDVGIGLDKKILKNINLFIKFNYQILDMYWSNTYQEDYVKNDNEYIAKNTLKFQQEFYKYNIGLSYKNNLTKNISLILKPSLVFTSINTKDTHILRNFYTIQDINAFGYKLKFAFKYRLTTKSNLKLSIAYINIKDENADMNYYNILNERFSSYPSTYNYKKTTVGIHYNYSF